MSLKYFVVITVKPCKSSHNQNAQRNFSALTFNSLCSYALVGKHSASGKYTYIYSLSTSQPSVILQENIHKVSKYSHDIWLKTLKNKIFKRSEGFFLHIWILTAAPVQLAHLFPMYMINVPALQRNKCAKIVCTIQNVDLAISSL